MGDPPESERPSKTGDEDRRRSRSVNDHIGFISILCGRWRKSGRLNEYQHEEVLNASIVEAERLLRETYDPSRSTACSFLSRWLFGRTSYRLLVQSGKRKTSSGWRLRVVPDSDGGGIWSAVGKDSSEVELEDLLANMHPDLRGVARRLSEGESLDDLAIELAEAPLFDTSGRQDPTVIRAELLAMLQRELRRLLS
jgi:hypothetical protein